MAEEKWSAFPNGGTMVTGDQLVGLRSGANTRLTPVLPAQVQQSAFNFAALGGSSNAFTVTLSPAVAALTDGMIVTFYSGSKSNTIAAPTLSVNGLTAVTIVCWSGGLAPNDITTATEYLCIYNLTDNVFQLVNPSISSANTFEVQANGYNYAPDTGIVNAYIANILPAQISTVGGGFEVITQWLHTNTLASTLTVNGTTAPIVDQLGNALAAGQIVANALGFLIYNHSYSSFVLMNPALQLTGAVLLNPSAAQTISTYGLTIPELAVVGNATANNFAPATSAIALVGGSSTLTNTSTQIIIFGGTGGTVVLPDATTLVVGWQYYFHNNTSGNVIINMNGGTLLTTMTAGTYINLTNLTIATSAGTWAFSWEIPQNVMWGTSTLSAASTSATFNTMTAGNLNLAGDVITCSDASNPMAFISDNTSLANALNFAFGSTTDAVTYLENGPGMQLAFNDGQANLSIMQYGTDNAGAGGGTINLITSYGTDVGSFALIDSPTEQLGTINWYGTNATQYVPGPQIIGALTSVVPSSGQPQSSLTFKLSNPSGGNLAVLTLTSPSTTTSLATFRNYIATAPVAGSQTSALIVGTAFHNTLGYDVVLTVYLSVTAATSASILLGVGKTTTPTQQTIVSGLTIASQQIIPVTIYLPSAYYALLSVSGTITETISGQQIMPV